MSRVRGSRRPCAVGCPLVCRGRASRVRGAKREKKKKKEGRAGQGNEHGPCKDLVPSIIGM